MSAGVRVGHGPGGQPELDGQNPIPTLPVGQTLTQKAAYEGQQMHAQPKVHFQGCTKGGWKVVQQAPRLSQQTQSLTCIWKEVPSGTRSSLW